MRTEENVSGGCVTTPHPGMDATADCLLAKAMLRDRFRMAEHQVFKDISQLLERQLKRETGVEYEITVRLRNRSVA